MARAPRRIKRSSQGACAPSPMFVISTKRSALSREENINAKGKYNKYSTLITELKKRFKSVMFVNLSVIALSIFSNNSLADLGGRLGVVFAARIWSGTPFRKMRRP